MKLVRLVIAKKFALVRLALPQVGGGRLAVTDSTPTRETPAPGTCRWAMGLNRRPITCMVK